MINIKEELDKAYLAAGENAYFGNGFKAGLRLGLEIIKDQLEKETDELHKNEASLVLIGDLLKTLDNR